MKYIVFLLLLFLVPASGLQAQKTWKLTRDREGIRVYQSGSSGFRDLRVECTLPGTYERFLNVLTDLESYSRWVYGNKEARLLRQAAPRDYIYYAETALPWPLANRDVVMQARITRDPQDRFLKLEEHSIDGILAEQPGKIRVRRSAISWLVTRPAPGQLQIVYEFSADPGGTIPAWVANLFADKGPYESFRKLAALLKN